MLPKWYAYCDSSVVVIAGHKLATTLFQWYFLFYAPDGPDTTPPPPAPLSLASLPHLAASVFVRTGGSFYVTNDTNINANINDSCFCMATFGIAKENAAGVVSATPLNEQGATATPPLPPARTMSPAFRCHFSILVRPCPRTACCRAGLLSSTGHTEAARFFQKRTIILILQHQEGQKLRQQRGR